MELDKEKLIAAEALLKAIIKGLTVEDDQIFSGKVLYRFKQCIKIAEDYARVDPEEEYINTGVRVPKSYWDTRDTKLIMEGNRPQKTEKGWFIFTRMKDIKDFKKFIEQEETNGV